MRFVIAAVPSIGRAVRVERQAPDAGATKDLYERYAPQIFGFCVNQLGSRDEAEDAVQSTFLNAHRALQRGVRPDCELAWLFKIAHNVCLTRRRSSWRRGRVEAPSDLQSVQDVLPAPAREQAEELIRLPDALADMPVNQRRAILLREWQGLSYREIAEELRLSQSAVETLIFRARRTLASNLEVEPERNGLLARVRQAFDVGTIFAALKTLLAGSTAVKATAAAVAVSGAVVVARTAPVVLPTVAKEKPRAVASAPAVSEASIATAAARPKEEPRAVRKESDAMSKPAVASAATAPAKTATRAHAPGLAVAAAVPSPAHPPYPAHPSTEQAGPPQQANGQGPSKPEKSAPKGQEKKTEQAAPPAQELNAPVETGPPAEQLPANDSNGNGPPEDKARGPKK